MKCLTHFLPVLTFTLFANFNAFSQPCIDSSLIDLNAGCLEIYQPVCGCDGVTYSNSCYAVVLGGVTSFTEGPCNSDNTVYADPCSDLEGVDFGDCDMALGFGVINGTCSSVSGCNFVVGDVDYSTAIYSDLEFCETCLDEEIVDAEPCIDLEGIDFGACSMYLGIANIGGSCIALSGCGTTVNGIDYAPAIYSDMESCLACLDHSGLNELNNSIVSFHPNPASNEINISFSATTQLDKVTLYDNSGMVIRIKYYENQSSLSFVFNTSGLNQGIYHICIEANGFTTMHKTILQ